MILCQFNNGCMGCCGNDYKDIDSVRQAVEKNTIEFKKFRNLKKFRDRADNYNLRDGVCRNAILVEGKVFCPLHPLKNNGKDLRKGHCDINYFCETAKEFRRWKKVKQEQFLEFIKNKNLDPIEYSYKMDNGELMKEFNS